MKLTKEDIARVGKLARIRLNDDEQKLYGEEITKILTWIEQLQEVDVSTVSLDDLIPKEKMGESSDVADNVSRLDDILKNAPNSKFGMFVVPKMVD